MTTSYGYSDVEVEAEGAAAVVDSKQRRFNIKCNGIAKEINRQGISTLIFLSKN